ncbi:MAG: serine hydrolase [Victivallaceae bacterium]|nr:serine hydrolase [Victivallaceae bacterium]
MQIRDIVFAGALVCQHAFAAECATPESVGVSSSAVVRFIDELEKQKWPENEYQSFVVMKNGKIIAEAYRAPYTADMPRFVASITKGFTGIAVGFAVQEKLVSLDERVIDIFPDRLPDPLPENAEKVTVRDLLTMQTGQNRCAANAMFNDEDHVRGFFMEPFVFEPGTSFRYNSGASNMLSQIITKRTGMSMLEYLTPRLFEPLGFGIPEWSADDCGVNFGGWGIAVTPRQMALLGQFCVQNGMWNGRQLLNRQWFEDMTANPAPTMDRHIADADWNYGYGLHVWLTHVEGITRFDGSGGQYIIMMPEENAVLAVTGCVGSFTPLMNILWNYLYPGLRGDRVPEVPDAANALKKRLAEFKCPMPVAGDGGFPAHVFADFSKGRLTRDGDGLTLGDISLDFDGKELRLTEGATAPLRFAVGEWALNEIDADFDRLFAMTFFGTAAVTAPNELTLICRYATATYVCKIVFKVDGDRVKVCFSDAQNTQTVVGNVKLECR